MHTWASPDDADNPERVSRVTYELEPFADAVRLTLTHEDLPSDQVKATEDGWALVLSSLKSFLETGTPLTSAIAHATAEARHA